MYLLWAKLNIFEGRYLEKHGPGRGRGHAWPSLGNFSIKKGKF